MIKPLRRSALTRSDDNRRNVAWRSQAGATSLRVPLWHANEKGEWREGVIRIPERLCHAVPDSNQAHERDGIIRANLERWAEWLSMKGWEMATPPKVRGPIDPPTPRVGELPDPDDFEMKHYYALARFKRRSPLYIGLDDMLEIQRVAALYGEETPTDPLPWNDTSGTYDSGWFDPLKEREEHYARTGINRADYLYPDSWGS